MSEKQNKTSFYSNPLKNPHSLVLMALLAALSIVLGKLCAFNVTPTTRISFENLPLLIGGILLGPISGLIIGAVADLVGCLIVGYAVNPIVTLGAMSIGFLSGVVYRALQKNGFKSRVFFSVLIPHVIGSMIIKTIGLYIYFHTAPQVLLLRIPTYIVISAAEYIIIKALLSNRGFVAQLSGGKQKK